MSSKVLLSVFVVLVLVSGLTEGSIGYFESYGWPSYGIVKPFWMTPFSAHPSRAISRFSRKHDIVSAGIVKARRRRRSICFSCWEHLLHHLCMMHIKAGFDSHHQKDHQYKMWDNDSTWSFADDKYCDNSCCASSIHSSIHEHDSQVVVRSQSEKSECKGGYLLASLNIIWLCFVAKVIPLFHYYFVNGKLIVNLIFWLLHILLLLSFLTKRFLL